MSSDEIRQLVTRAQQGDADALGMLYDIHVDAIYRYVRFRVPGVADAEDLAAEVFLNMVKRLPKYRQTGAPFEAWLYRIASTLVADFYRQMKRRPQAELSEMLSGDDPTPEDQVQQEQELSMLMDAWQALNTDQQTILFLRFRERKSHEEVAAITGKSVNAVRNAQHRALGQLAARLGSEGKARHYLRGQDV